MTDRHSLPIHLRVAGRPVVLVGEGAAANAYRRRLERAGARIVAEGSNAALAIVVDDVAAVSRLKVRGALVCAVGRPDLSDFTLPDLKERKTGPFMRLRGAARRIVRGVGAGFARLLLALWRALSAPPARAAAAIRDRFPSSRRDRVALDILLAEGGPFDAGAARTDIGDSRKADVDAPPGALGRPAD